MLPPVRGDRSQISVVIPTHNRIGACRRAVASALDQEAPPLEVLVCDDGSTDGTQDEIEAWAHEEARLRYLRLPHQGSPAAARNLGIETAKGEWIAFLDSDDVWLPDKLRIQGESIATGRYEVVASDAERSSGGPYLGLSEQLHPDQAEFLRHNPIITSTAVARRSSLLSMGGFSRSVLGMTIKGVEDYAIWLTLAYHGARFLVLGERLAIYADEGTDKVSGAAARQEAQVAAVRWRLWLRRPYDPAVLGSALRGTADAVRWRSRARREAMRVPG
jgi:teichuronic acid biosynthesis glycosyltransferase TuaG